MREVMRHSMFLLYGGLLVAAACSDDTLPAADTGGTPVDTKQEPRDGGPRWPDGPRKPASWVLVQGAAPAVHNHSATALQDGRVLIAGGFLRESGGVDKPRSESYLFDPKTNTFKPVGKLKTARAQHQAVLLSDGRVLVLGGRQSTYNVLASVEIYDANKGTWSQAGAMTVERVNHAAVLMKDGNVLTVGGAGKEVWQPHKSLEIFKPTSNSWTVLGLALAQGRALTSATSLGSGKVIIAGGYDGTKWLNSIITFDPVAGNLTVQKTTLGEARCAHSATLTSDGRVLLVGGTCGAACTIKSNELYNPTTGQVTAVTHSGAPPNNHRAVRLPDGRVLVTGGSTTKVQAKAVVYSSAMGGSWTSLPEMKYARASHSATLLPDGSVLVVGGYAGAMVTRAERLHNP